MRILALLFTPMLVAAQAPATQKADTGKVPRLFRAEAPLTVSLTANWKRLRSDRDTSSPYRWATISYAGDSAKVTVPLKVKTHGIWRLKHCDFPPLRLSFGDKTTKQTLFHDVQKPKMVSPCRDGDDYEQLALREMQLYRIYQLITPNSHRVRTLRVSYVDSASGKAEATRYAFLFEDPDMLADRLGGKMLKTKGATFHDINNAELAVAYLFQYFIANTDFSFNQLHNGELVMRPDGSMLTPVAYDFDFSGAVNAPYATADPSLGIRKVRERLYRGYCVLAPENPKAAALFRDRKAQIHALYKDDVGKLIDARTVRETLEYFDEFFDRIRTDAEAQGQVFRYCVGQR